ncbi:unnamed protein product [Timema podura]|uniref:HAP1 N-terminal domain-containing protein n=1 Tax=Timema podura TaxID=61482 RepID=A0ABN7PD73_TIMPD|nr:unnamed protein product [Timema podura]
MSRDTDDCEEAEQRLVRDIASQLANANMEVDGMADELQRYKEESRQQHEKNVSLISKLTEADVNIARLATELADLKDRYAEVMSLLHDTQEQLRRQRRKGMPQARGGSLFPSLSTTVQPDSLASELESSLYSDFSLDSGISTDRYDGTFLLCVDITER